MVLRKGMVLAKSRYATRILASSLDTFMLGEEALWPGECIVTAGCITLTAAELHCIVVERLQRLLEEMPAEYTHQVVRVGRGRWLRQKCSLVVPAAHRVRDLFRERAARPGSRPPSFVELLNAADGGGAWRASKQGRMAQGAWHSARLLQPVDLRELRKQDPETRELLRESFFNVAESAYVLPAQLTFLVVSRAAPTVYEAAEVACVRIQRFFRYWRYRFKFSRLRDDLKNGGRERMRSRAGSQDSHTTTT